MIFLDIFVEKIEKQTENTSKGTLADIVNNEIHQNLI